MTAEYNCQVAWSRWNPDGSFTGEHAVYDNRPDAAEKAAQLWEDEDVTMVVIHNVPKESPCADVGHTGEPSGKRS